MILFILLKSLHFISMTLWVGGMFMLGMTIDAWRCMPDSNNKILPFTNTIHRWNQYVLIPTMILTWFTGISMTLMGDWPPSTSLLVKIVFVMLLSAMHGMQSGALRRAVTYKHPTILPRLLNYSCEFTLSALVLSVLLIVLKLF